MAQVALKQVTKAFGRTEVIHGVDLDIADGEFVVLVGPSGCGKSTILRLIAGLEDATTGEIAIGGTVVNDLPPAERGIAMVFQSYALYPHMNVYQNMAFGLELARASRAEIDARVRGTAEMLRIAGLLDRKPRELSGGERQRVAIGRALVRQPKVFLFDEPLSNLDAALRVETRIELAKLHAGLGATMIYVTHDQVEAMTLADRIVVLNAGRVEQVGAPLDLYHRPANLFVAGFIGSPRMNFIECGIESRGATSVRCRLPDGGTVDVAVSGEASTGETVVLGIRPEHLLLGDGAEARLTGRIEVIEQLGDSHLVHVRMANGQMLTARTAGDARHRSGDAVTLGLPAAACHLFRRSGEALRRR